MRGGLLMSRATTDDGVLTGVQWPTLAALAWAGLTLTGPATAADIPVKVPVYKAQVAATHDWSGFYLGAQGGYGWRDPSIDFSGNAAAETAFFQSGALARSVAVDPRGWLGGIEAGYNQQFARWVLGVEADFAWADISDAGTATTGVGVNPLLPGVCISGVSCTTDTFQFASNGRQRLDRFGTVRARGGVAVTDRLLLFATGGLAYGDATLDAGVANTSGVQVTTLNGIITAGPFALPPCTSVCAAGSASQWLLGWTIGGGFEYALDRHWSIKTDYLFYDLGRLSVAFADPKFPTFAFTASAPFAGHIARVGVNFKFN